MSQQTQTSFSGPPIRHGQLFPKLRVIDESLYDPDQAVSSFSSPRQSCEKTPGLETTQRLDSTAQSADAYPKHVCVQEEYEIRDEGAQSRFERFRKLFDEHEYKRSTKAKRGPDGAVIKPHKWYHWYEETDTPAERRLLLKLDLILCLFSFLMYWVKSLDSININSAYVSGMKEDLDMKGGDLINTFAIFSVGSVVFELPLMYVVYKFPMHLLLPGMDLGWGLFTLLLYRTQSVSELQVYRFFVGVFESAFYPTVHYLFGCWYKPQEYARRASIFYFGQTLGALTASLLQGSTFEHLNGVHGLEGWRWMFIIDAIITFPVAIIGFWCIPGTPDKCYSVFLSDKEIYLARKRLRDANIAMKTETASSFFSKSLWRSILVDWRFYFFILIKIFANGSSNTVSSSYLIWLKSLGQFSTPKVNQLSGIAPAFGFFWISLVGLVADGLKSRWTAILLAHSLNIMANSLLIVWFLPKALIWFAYAFQYCGWATDPALYAWVADSLRADPQRRAITLISMNIVSHIVSAIASVFVWKTSEGPRFLKGYCYAVACSFAFIVGVTVFLPLYKKDERKYAAQNGILLYNSKKGELPPTIEMDSEPASPTLNVSAEIKEMDLKK